jgi:hypothetical protein
MPRSKPTIRKPKATLRLRVAGNLAGDMEKRLREIDHFARAILLVQEVPDEESMGVVHTLARNIRRSAEALETQRAGISGFAS